jgi:uncharacterized caspase-like protein
MQRPLKTVFAVLAFLAVVSSPAAATAGLQKRLALVIGNASYTGHALATPVNDAALISQTLQSAGFEVTGARDLDEALLRRAFREFADKVANAGPAAIVVVYFAGDGLQFEGKNYLVPVGADIAVASDIPVRALGLSEVMHALAAPGMKASFVILDAARASPFALQGQAGGLAWIEPEANMLIAYNAAPGTAAPDVGGSYGPYARALAEMIRKGGLTPGDLFDRVRLRVHDVTKGAQVPWSASKIETQFKFLERTQDAPAQTDALARSAQLRVQPMRALGAQDAYTITLMRDTFDAYTDFLAEYWQDPLTKRIRVLLAARRESITWQRTFQANEPVAYWSYLERYPVGPHAADARRLLTQLGEATTPPSKFARIDYDVPPPLPDELEYIERPMLVLDDPAFGFEPPPPTPANFLEPPPQELLNLKPPAASAGHALPVLNLPLQALLRVPPGVWVSPNSSNSAREAWAMRPAIDVPAASEKVAESPSISSSLASGNANDPANAAHASSPVDDGATRNKNPRPKIETQEATNETTLRLASSSQASPTPQWFTDIVTVKNHGNLLRSPIADSEFLTTAPSMFTPAGAGLTFVPPMQTTLDRSAAVGRSAAVVQSPARSPGDISSEAVLSPQTAGGAPDSSPLSATPALAAASNLSEPSANTTKAVTPTSPLRTVSGTPRWLTDIVTARNQGISSGPPMSNSEVQTSAPSMFASASAGLTFQTWRYGLLSSRIARSAALARPRVGLPGEATSAAILSPQGTNTPRSTPRPAALLPAAIGSPSRASVGGAEPSSTAANQAKPRNKPSLTKPVPPTQSARNPSESGETPPPNPQ